MMWRYYIELGGDLILQYLKVWVRCALEVGEEVWEGLPLISCCVRHEFVRITLLSFLFRTLPLHIQP